MNHIIGEGSSYDADMILIESFVRAHNEPKNIIAQTSVFSYYISQLYNYWEIFKKTIPDIEFISSNLRWDRIILSPGSIKVKELREKIYGEFVNIKYIKENYTNAEEAYQYLYPINYKDLKPIIMDDITLFPNVEYSDIKFYLESGSVFPGREKQFIMDNIQRYEERFLYLISYVQGKFDKKRSIDMDKITALYKYIGRLLCLDPGVELSDTPISKYENIEYGNMKKYKEYLLPNNSGLFGFNTYLYALFSGVILVGIPSGIAVYDNITGCPLDFIGHDYDHDGIIGRKVLKKDITNTINIYYNILNSNFSRKLKELLILVMWIIIHEGTRNVFNKIDFDDYYDLIKNMTRLPFVTEFNDEFNSFENIINTEENMILIQEIYPKFNLNFNNEDIYYLVMLYGYLIIVDNWMR